MINFSDYLKQLRKSGQISFTANQAAKDLQTSKSNILVAIGYIKKQGDLISPAKGFYIIVPPEHQKFGCIPAEELVPILAKHLKINYYSGLLTAAMYHGATHQKPNSFQIISDKQIKRELRFGDVCIKFFYKKSLANLPLELTAMDLLLYPSPSGGINHTATVLSEIAEKIDPKKLIDLAKNSKGTAWIQRLGYILEKIDTENNDHRDLVVNAIIDHLSSQKLSFITLVPEISPAGYVRCKKWKIIENTTVESDL
jgi:predicted transcriptional regulator of viral defense system